MFNPENYFHYIYKCTLLNVKSKRRGRLNAGDDSGTSLDQRQCWICLGTEEDTPNANWLHPCRCRGSSKWVHEHCLYRWIDEIQRGNIDAKVVCTQCRTEYLMIIPPAGYSDGLIEYIDKHYEHLCPSVFGGMILATIYFSAVTYGAVTVLQVFGYEEGMELLNEGDPALMLMGLPAIPIALLFGRSLNWVDLIIRLLRLRGRRRSSNFSNNQTAPTATTVPLNSRSALDARNQRPISRNIDNENIELDNVAMGFHSDRFMRNIRNFVSALILPSCAVLTGRLLFDSFDNRVQRTLLGGFTFIIVKGIGNIYMRQCKYSRKLERKVLNYTEQNVQLYGRRQRRH